MFGRGGLQGILKEDVLIKGIIFRCSLLCRFGIIDGSIEFGSFRKHLSDVALHCEVILFVVIEATLRKALIHSSESGRFFMSSEVHHRYVAQREIGIDVCSPTSRLIEVGHSELIHPDCAVLYSVRLVADSYEHDPDVAKARISEHADGVMIILRISRRIDYVVAHTLHVSTSVVISLCLKIGEGIKSHIEEV